MRIVRLEAGTTHVFGRCGETNGTKIVLDVTDWHTAYPDGVGTLLYIWPNDKMFPLDTELVREQGADVWDLEATLTDHELLYPGWAVVKGAWYDGTTLVYSKMYSGKVLTNNEDMTVEENTPNWVSELIENISDARDVASKIEEINQYIGIAEQSASDSEAWAVGKRGGVDVDSDDETYENNAKKYMMDAGGSATAALSLAKDAEAWANGTQYGQEIASTHPAYQKNSKYWSEHAFSATPQGYEELVNSVYGHLVSDEVKIALLACLRNVAWTTPEGQTYYDALESMLNPPANLAYITAAYTQRMTVETIDELSVLRADLVVTAHYGDESTAQVYGYLLSGTLTEGTSTVTVTYGGKTATFAVTVSAAYLTPGRTYILNAPASWQMNKYMSYVVENNGKAYSEMVLTGSTGTRALTYLFPVAPGGIKIKWNSDAYTIFPSFWDTDQRWKYMAFNNNVYLTVSPSSYSAADIASYGVKYFAIVLGRNDNAALSDADLTAANIQLEVL